jgi:hypothetical protein
MCNSQVLHANIRRGQGRGVFLPQFGERGGVIELQRGQGFGVFLAPFDERGLQLGRLNGVLLVLFEQRAVALF